MGSERRYDRYPIRASEGATPIGEIKVDRRGLAEAVQFLLSCNYPVQNLSDEAHRRLNADAVDMVREMFADLGVTIIEHIIQFQFRQPKKKGRKQVLSTPDLTRQFAALLPRIKKTIAPAFAQAANPVVAWAAIRKIDPEWAKALETSGLQREWMTWDRHQLKPAQLADSILAKQTGATMNSVTKVRLQKTKPRRNRK